MEMLKPQLTGRMKIQAAIAEAQAKLKKKKKPAAKKAKKKTVAAPEKISEDNTNEKPDQGKEGL